MEAADFVSVVKWMVPRWVEVAAWEPPEWEAFKADLDGYSAGTILSALYRLWQNGREKPPKSGTVLAMLHELGLRPEPTRPQLPPPKDTTPTVSLGDYAEVRYGGMAGLWKAIREGKIR
jgi:hypothetical protein